MCSFIKDNNQCKITNTQCPFIYYCIKKQIWKPLNGMENCKVKNQNNIPKGYYKVCFERHGNLYIDIDNVIKIVPNPFETVPLFVKLIVYKNGKIKLKQWEETG